MTSFADKGAIPSVSVSYAGNGSSTKANEFGMRPMQERAFEKRGEQYLLIKSPRAWKSKLRIVLGSPLCPGNGFSRRCLPLMRLLRGSRTARSPDMFTTQRRRGWSWLRLMIAK